MHIVPTLPFQAWVPRPDGSLGLRCSLCERWVVDDFCHSGTHDNPFGSTKHVRMLANYGTIKSLVRPARGMPSALPLSGGARLRYGLFRNAARFFCPTAAACLGPEEAALGPPASPLPGPQGVALRQG